MTKTLATLHAVLGLILLAGSLPAPAQVPHGGGANRRPVQKAPSPIKQGDADQPWARRKAKGEQRKAVGPNDAGDRKARQAPSGGDESAGVPSEKAERKRRGNLEKGQEESAPAKVRKRKSQGANFNSEAKADDLEQQESRTQSPLTGPGVNSTEVE